MILCLFLVVFFFIFGRIEFVWILFNLNKFKAKEKKKRNNNEKNDSEVTNRHLKISREWDRANRQIKNAWILNTDVSFLCPFLGNVNSLCKLCFDFSPLNAGYTINRYACNVAVVVAVCAVAAVEVYIAFVWVWKKFIKTHDSYGII